MKKRLPICLNKAGNQNQLKAKEVIKSEFKENLRIVSKNVVLMITKL